MLLNLLVGLNMALRPLDQEDPKMSTFIGAFVLVLRGLISLPESSGRELLEA